MYGQRDDEGLDQENERQKYGLESLTLSETAAQYRDRSDIPLSREPPATHGETHARRSRP